MVSNELVRAIKLDYKQTSSYRRTAKNFKISKSQIQRICTDQVNKPQKKRGPKLKIAPREETRIKKVIRSEINLGHRVTCKKIKDEAGLDVSLSTLDRQVKRMGFHYDHFIKTLPLIRKHKQDRVEFVKN